MKALSLWQPWATLWVHGLKINETRGRGLSHRGLLAVHACKRWTRGQEELCCEPAFKAALAPLAGLPADCSDMDLLKALPSILPLGAVVGHVTVTDAMRMTESVIRMTSERERALGDWHAGRVAICAANHHPYSKPLPWKGQQGLFEIPTNTIAAHLGDLIAGGAA